MKKRREEKTYMYATAQIVRPRLFIKKLLRRVLGCMITGISYMVSPPRKADAKYYASICAIFRDEDRYLKEWIEFHLIIGIDHFYLYNNFSSDNYLEVLRPYIDKGVVTLIDWPVENGQLSAYRDCIANYSEENNWIGFIDLDEFVVPNQFDNIKEFLQQYRRHAAVVLYWRYFGTSGILERNESNLVVEDFTVCWPKYANIGKCFYNTDFEFDSEYYEGRDKYLHHLFWGRYKSIHFPPVNAFHKHVLFNDHCIPSSEVPVQINHYLLKSYKEYVDRKTKKGGGTHGPEMHDMEYFNYREMRCQSVDYHAYKYLIRLKLAMRDENGIDN